MKRKGRERERTRKPNSPWNIYCLTMEMKEELRELDRVVKKKIPAKVSEESFVWADWPCIGCLGQWAAVGRDNSNMQEFFARPCTTHHFRECV